MTEMTLREFVSRCEGKQIKRIPLGGGEFLIEARRRE